MAILPKALMSAFQSQIIGTAVTGLSGIVPYRHKDVGHTVQLRPVNERGQSKATGK